MPLASILLRSKAGIKRDGTKFDGDYYVDGQWVRFQRELPRKMGGYRSINKYLAEISRGFSSFTQAGLQYCHSGSATLLQRFTIDSSKNRSAISDRTPTALIDSSDNKWMFDVAYDSSTSDNMLLAHVAPNNNCICNDSDGQIFAGDITATTALTPVTIPAGANATGGIVAMHPYLVYYGTAGVVGWSVAGSPTDLSGAGSGIARPWGQKIIKGFPLRAGSGSAPAGIFWAYDAVIRMSFTGGSTVFAFDTIATGTSIASPDAVVDYDGVFFWAGVDRFMMFNGVVRDVPNQMNINWYLDNLNDAQRAKVFAFKVPRFGEIWWCFPYGDATECTHAVIYNVKENSWYDTILPASGRSAGGFNNAFASPLLTDAVPTPSGYRVWIHEQGQDEIDGTRSLPIQSYFETADLSSLLQGTNAAIRVSYVEPDFIQSGAMTLQVSGRSNARASEVYSREYTFPDIATEPFEEIVMLKEQRRELRFRFESNVIGGDYQMGLVLAHVQPGDGTTRS